MLFEELRNMVIDPEDINLTKWVKRTKIDEENTERTPISKRIIVAGEPNLLMLELKRLGNMETDLFRPRAVTFHEAKEALEDAYFRRKVEGKDVLVETGGIGEYWIMHIRKGKQFSLKKEISVFGDRGFMIHINVPKPKESREKMHR